MQNAKLSSEMVALMDGNEDNECRLVVCKVQNAALHDARELDQKESRGALRSALDDVAAANARATQHKAAADAARKSYADAVTVAATTGSLLLVISSAVEAMKNELRDVQQATEVRFSLPAVSQLCIREEKYCDCCNDDSRFAGAIL
jgi:hypothetical protein